MKLTVTDPYDEDCRYRAIKRWHKLLYSIDNSIILYQIEGDKNVGQLSYPDVFPATYEESKK